MYGEIIHLKPNGDPHKAFPVTLVNVYIGRSKYCDIRIEKNKVEEKHCHLIVGNGKAATISNLSTENPILINGTVVEPGVLELQDKDIITVVDEKFQWCYPESLEESMETKMNLPVSPKRKRTSEPLQKPKAEIVNTPTNKQKNEIRRKRKTIGETEAIRLKKTKIIDKRVQTLKRAALGTPRRSIDVARALLSKVSRKSAVKLNSVKKRRSTSSSLKSPEPTEKIMIRKASSTPKMKNKTARSSQKIYSFNKSIMNRASVTPNRSLRIPKRLGEGSGKKKPGVVSRDKSPRQSPKSTKKNQGKNRKHESKSAENTPKSTNKGLIKNTPKSAKKTSNSVKKTPDSVKKTPNSVKKTPDSVKKTPNSVKKTPNSAKKTPKSLKKPLEKASRGKKSSEKTPRSTKKSLMKKTPKTPLEKTPIRGKQSGEKNPRSTKNQEKTLRSERKSPKQTTPKPKRKSLRNSVEEDKPKLTAPNTGGKVKAALKSPTYKTSPLSIKKPLRKSISPKLTKVLSKSPKKSPKTLSAKKKVSVPALKNPKSTAKKSTPKVSGETPKAMSSKRKLENTATAGKSVQAAKKLKLDPSSSLYKKTTALTSHRKSLLPKFELKKILYSDMVKKRAALALKRAKTPAKVPKVLNKNCTSKYKTKIPDRFKFSNRHANSPDPIVISKKSPKTVGKKAQESSSKKTPNKQVNQTTKRRSRATTVLSNSQVKTPPRFAKAKLASRHKRSILSALETKVEIKKAGISVDRFYGNEPIQREKDDILNALDLARKSDIIPGVRNKNSRRLRSSLNSPSYSFSSRTIIQGTKSKFEESSTYLLSRSTGSITLSSSLSSPEVKKSVSFFSNEGKSQIPKHEIPSSSNSMATNSESKSLRSSSSSPVKMLKPKLKSAMKSKSCELLSEKDQSQFVNQKSPQSGTKIAKLKIASDQTPQRIGGKASDDAKFVTPSLDSVQKLRKTLARNVCWSSDKTPKSAKLVNRQSTPYVKLAGSIASPSPNCSINISTDSNTTTFDFDEMNSPNISMDLFVSSLGSDRNSYLTNDSGSSNEGSKENSSDISCHGKRNSSLKENQGSSKFPNEKLSNRKFESFSKDGRSPNSSSAVNDLSAWESSKVTNELGVENPRKSSISDIASRSSRRNLTVNISGVELLESSVKELSPLENNKIESFTSPRSPIRMSKLSRSLEISISPVSGVMELLDGSIRSKKSTRVSTGSPKILNKSDSSVNKILLLAGDEHKSGSSDKDRLKRLSGGRKAFSAESLDKSKVRNNVEPRRTRSSIELRDGDSKLRTPQNSSKLRTKQPIGRRSKSKEGESSSNGPEDGVINVTSTPRSPRKSKHERGPHINEGPTPTSIFHTGYKKLFSTFPPDQFNVSGIKHLFANTEEKNSYMDVCGVKKLFQEEKKTGPSPRLSGIRTLFHEERVTRSPRLAGVKDLFLLEKEAPSPKLGGIRKLFKIEKGHQSPKLSGVKKLFQSEKVIQTPKFVGIRELFQPPKESKSPRFVGVRKLMKEVKTPASPDLNGIKEIFTSPKTVSSNKRKAMVPKRANSITQDETTVPSNTEETTRMILRGEKDEAPDREKALLPVKKRKIAQEPVKTEAAGEILTPPVRGRRKQNASESEVPKRQLRNRKVETSLDQLKSRGSKSSVEQESSNSDGQKKATETISASPTRKGKEIEKTEKRALRGKRDNNISSEVVSPKQIKEPVVKETEKPQKRTLRGKRDPTPSTDKSPSSTLINSGSPLNNKEATRGRKVNEAVRNSTENDPPVKKDKSPVITSKRPLRGRRGNTLENENLDQKNIDKLPTEDNDLSSGKKKLNPSPSKKEIKVESSVSNIEDSSINESEKNMKERNEPVKEGNTSAKVDLDGLKDRATSTPVHIRARRRKLVTSPEMSIIKTDEVLCPSEIDTSNEKKGSNKPKQKPERITRSRKQETATEKEEAPKNSDRRLKRIEVETKKEILESESENENEGMKIQIGKRRGDAENSEGEEVKKKGKVASLKPSKKSADKKKVRFEGDQKTRTSGRNTRSSSQKR